MKLTKHQIAAAEYTPLETNVLFIAEAPPAALNRYFYFENVQEQDSLWVGLMKALYRGEFGETSKERLRKKKWLTQFKDDGYRLVDALKHPVSQSMNSRKRKALILERTDRIIEEVGEISPNQIVLIKATVFDALYDPLNIAGLPVINEKLPFPGSGQQRVFDIRFRNLISDGRLNLSK